MRGQVREGPREGGDEGGREGWREQGREGTSEEGREGLSEGVYISSPSLFPKQRLSHLHAAKIRR